ncbi:zinc ribbon-containing protein [Martelella alba]|uniref:Zinc ribbon-containing protein n=1 Tax=Martelella alba TaxID=2590451 RepID=A0ABY2SKX3_9HYPH|nr:zinc ribbon-containing protein [Martelella alba]TKI05475.1 zinc ribbon-containing protein [Martelella alba]
MDKVTAHYRTLLASLGRRIEQGERDIDALVDEAHRRLLAGGELTPAEADSVTRSVRRDIREFARSYDESRADDGDSVFTRIIKESLWQELADITDKTQLEWREIFKDVAHHGVYSSGEVVGLGNLVCERCHHAIAFYTPEVLPLCPHCGFDQFQRRPF